MIKNFYIIEITEIKKTKIYFEHYNQAFAYCRQLPYNCEIWHCSKYLIKNIKLSTVINDIDYTKFIKK